jgi:hypothetical protein
MSTSRTFLARKNLIAQRKATIRGSFAALPSSRNSGSQRQTDIEPARSRETEQDLGVANAMAGTSQDNRSDVVKIHRFGFVGGPGTVGFKKLARFGMDHEPFEFMVGFGHPPRL